ncbi:GNAT family N-acetyltransferase [Deinococcus sp. HMF7620]|uniref:GNAT family N-acetyltransferase n=1 Tax=Deinococcus arboris TaxID=2682977 RepID=A0A7C9LPJ1_9DEIO|nr:GNAT family N-acetyltransferase [Deinococcus arboris]MVN88877.1 GNAT family N-acetyltransferase [Deinococcus arboris]
MTAQATQLIHRSQHQFTEAFAHQLVAHLNRLRQETHPDDPPVNPEHVWGQMQHLPPLLELDLWTVEDGSGIHAHARTQLMNTEDNQHLADLELMVAPDWRGRGVGGSLLRRAAQAMQARGRSLLLARTTDRVSAGEAFAAHCGFTPGLANHENRLLLSDLPDGLLERWTTRPADSYTLEVWEGAVPEADLAAYAALLSVMNSAPRGDLKAEDTTVSAQEVRELESLSRAGGRVSLTAVVRAPDGTLAGLNDLSWRASQPGIVSQGNTGVLAAHRGHGLGRWLKAANVAHLRRLSPQAREIRTQNADSNSAMLKINTEMGFRPFMATTIWQGEIDTILSRLPRED